MTAFEIQPRVGWVLCRARVRESHWALVATVVIRRQLCHVNPFDPPTLSLAVVVLAGMVYLRAYIPARHAARIEALKARRVE